VIFRPQVAAKAAGVYDEFVEALEERRDLVDLRVADEPDEAAGALASSSAKRSVREASSGSWRAMSSWRAFSSDSRGARTA
jgi:acyl-CoA reductase-like NAD-dependent aldehyde dehydrogenase